MVECNLILDNIFQSLADGTRRDMLRLLRIYDRMSIGEIAAHYRISFAGAAKHIKVLESAKLITKRRKGKQQIVSLSPAAFKTADQYLEDYRQLWEGRFDRLEKLLNEEE